ncbi:uncharacterized protein LOC101861862 [Aplysia californica]|uniref:Uncharacterized protein LOC101861862 n=1 Tax=Aplysia californica TaxID=6500 RepID=A0ABM1ADU9_APLCA|nr:uncharacterized protein LOC101861862 [Aplysia californica]
MFETTKTKDDDVIENAASPTSLSSASPPNFLTTRATSSASATVTRSPAGPASRAAADGVTVKVEPPDDIKDYVETTMNELLGWYGLPKMDKADTGHLALASLPSPAFRKQAQPSATSTTCPTSNNSTSSKERRNSSNSNNGSNNCKANSNSVEDSSEHPPATKDALKRSTRSPHKANLTPPSVFNNDANNNSSSCGPDDDDDDLDDDEDDDDFNELREEMEELRDTGSVASDISAGRLVSPVMLGGGVPESERGVPIVCSWCQKNGTKLFTLATPTGVKSFCSEVCFTQCRRASFKKNKVCDWCKHVRHTVNFVDFQEGEVQVQFCSEKCLNQYKMNIFCTEARQHLQHIQNLAGEGADKGKGDRAREKKKGEILITPELWLSNGGGHDDVCVKKEVGVDGDAREGQSRGKRGEGDYGVRKGRDEEEGEEEEEEEPGELREREKEKSRRETALEMSVRNALISEESNNSNDDRFRKEMSSPSNLNRRRSPSNGGSSVSPMLKPVDKTSSSENRFRRDRERIRKLMVEGKYREGRAGGASTSGGFRDKPERLTTSQGHSRTHHAGLSPLSSSSPSSSQAAVSSSNSNSAEHAAASSLISNWATSQLLAMMPGHLGSALPNPGVNPNLVKLGYDSSPLLYSSLFGPTPMLLPSAQKDAVAMTAAAVASSNQLRSRHESRRELLRDRDRSRESSERGEQRKRDNTNERSSTASAVPLSPSSTSHSSEGTPGPSTAMTTMTPGMINHHGLPPGGQLPSSLMTENSRHHFPPHPFLTGEVNQNVPLAHYFMDPALAGMFPLPFPPHTQPQPSTAHPPLRPVVPHQNPGAPGGSTMSGGTSAQPGSSTQSSTPAQPAAPPHPGAAPAAHPPLLPLPGFPPPSNGLPPVTVLVPYPFAVPVPVPIPIPLPISPEKLANYFKEKQEANKTPATTSSNSSQRCPPNEVFERRSRSSSEARSRTSSVGHTINPSPSASPHLSSSKCSPIGPFVPGPSLLESPDAGLALPGGRESADSIMTLRREIGRSSHTRDSISPSSSTGGHKRCFTPPHHTYSLDLCKRPRLECPIQHDENEAMDLSKMSSRSSSPRKSLESSERDNNRTAVKSPASVTDVDSDSSSLPQNLKVPRIHIVSERSEPPLYQPSASIPLPPLTPDPSSYSSRRSRILDAPNVPKKSRSPSPERRYARTVPRDMVEAARRRGLRARVRTK